MFIIFSDDDFISYYPALNFSSHFSFEYGCKCVHGCVHVCAGVQIHVHVMEEGTIGQFQVSFPRTLHTSLIWGLLMQSGC